MTTKQQQRKAQRKARQARRQAKMASQKATRVAMRRKRLPNSGATIVAEQDAMRAAMTGRPRPVPLGSLAADVSLVFQPRFGPARAAGINLPGRSNRQRPQSVFLPGGPFDPMGV